MVSPFATATTRAPATSRQGSLNLVILLIANFIVVSFTVDTSPSSAMNSGIALLRPRQARLDAIAAIFLGPVEGLIGGFKQGVELTRAPEFELGHADADSDHWTGLGCRVGHTQVGNRQSNAFGN